MARKSWRDRRDTALGLGILLCVIALVLYEIRGSYDDLQLLRRGTPSFAYVTRVHANWASKNGARSDSCDLEAMIPREVQASAPQTLPDMTEARYFTAHEPIGDRRCSGALHTWQPILFDPGDRGHARFTWGLRESWSQLVAMVLGLTGLALVVTVIRGLRRFRARRVAHPPT